MHIITKVFSSVLMRSEVYSIELYVRTFVGYLWHVGGVFPVVSYFLHQSTDRQDITEIKLIARGVKYNNPYSIEKKICIFRLVIRSLVKYLKVVRYACVHSVSRIFLYSQYSHCHYRNMYYIYQYSGRTRQLCKMSRGTCIARLKQE